jgi:hypothetical protein
MVDGTVVTAANQLNSFDPVLLDPGVNIQALAGKPFQGEVSTFSTTDPRATASEFTAIVNWGDGQSSNGTIMPVSSGGFQVVGNHTYSRAGAFSISTTVRNNEGQTVSDTSVATVADVPIVETALSRRTTRGKVFDGALLTITDPNGAALSSDFSALINWGDGSSSTGTVVETGSSATGATFTVFGSHSYARARKYSASIAVRDDGASQRLVPVVIAPGGRGGRPVPSGNAPKAPLHAGSTSVHKKFPHGPLAAIKTKVAVKQSATHHPAPLLVQAPPFQTRATRLLKQSKPAHH